MGVFSIALSERNISSECVLRMSARLEALGRDGRVLRQRRWKKRKLEAEKSYADAGLGKPPSGRGVSPEQLKAALTDAPLSPRVRAKLLRAVNALLSKRGDDALDSKVLFAGAAVRAGSPRALDERPR